MRPKERLRAWARTAWIEIRHKDDTTDEEKERLVDKMRNSPPISQARAFLDPSMLAEAYRELKRYRGETWFWPRLAWYVVLAVSGLLALGYVLSLPTDAAQDQQAAREPLPLGLYAALLLIFLFSHTLVTLLRLYSTSVWCHVVQRGIDESIEAVLSIMVYRLPFLDPSRENPAPWRKTWWKTTETDITLETEKDVSQLSPSDIYDETVCWVRPLAAIPPTAKRYAVRKIEPYGDIAIKERREFILRIRPQALLIIIGIAGVAVAAVVPILVALWRPTMD